MVDDSGNGAYVNLIQYWEFDMPEDVHIPSPPRPIYAYYSRNKVHAQKVMCQAVTSNKIKANFHNGSSWIMVYKVRYVS